MRAPFNGAHIFRGRRDVADVRRLVHDCAVGRAKSIAFVLPPHGVWPLPLYEIALMTSAELRANGVSDVRVALVTPERAPLALFGAAASDTLAELLSSRGIELLRGSTAVRVEAGALVLSDGQRVEADRVMTLPVPEGRVIRGLPHDDHGFVPVDDHGRVDGLADVFAAGDVTTFPIKQGGLAAQQADAVAEAIAAELGAAVSPRPFTPVLRGMLLTGGSPLYLRCEPGRDGSSIATEMDPGHDSVAADQALWWPPEKVAGRYLAGFLATGRLPTADDEMTDRAPVAGARMSEAELQEAIDLSLVMADADAACGDYASALAALGAAEALAGVLPPECEAKRRAWSAAQPEPPFSRRC
jgi:sulfide:quinone oxidoreductase